MFPKPLYSTITAVILLMHCMKVLTNITARFTVRCYGTDFGSVSCSPIFVILFHFLPVNALSSHQLFRRVAAALPGMESLDDANPEGSIL